MPEAGELFEADVYKRQEYTMNDRVQWCVAAVPAPGWAAKVFPELDVYKRQVPHGRLQHGR